MKRFLSALLLMSFLAVSACKEGLVDAVQNSVVRVSSTQTVQSVFGLETGTSICTGFTIAPEIVLTANHCLGTNLLADGYPTIILKGDVYYDLAVIKVPKSTRPALTLRLMPADRGEDLIGIGYANGWVFPIGLSQKVLLPSYAVGDRLPVGIITQGGYVKGMSGGPVIDLNGDVVGIVQQTNSGLGFGVGTVLIRAFLLDAGITLP